jgi:hypothetical protein
MPFSFPASPAVNATSTQNGREYRYAGNNTWELVAASGGGSLSATVTIPASDPNYASTLLLARFDGNFSDSGPNALTATVGGSATTSGTTTKFGGGAAYFPSGSNITNNVIKYGSGSQWNLMGADFTIEAWIYAEVASNYHGLISRDNQDDRRNWALLIDFDGVKPLSFVAFNTSAGQYITLADSQAFSLNQWVHVAVVRDSGVFRLYKNGVQVASAAASGGTGTLSTASGPISIGALNESGAYGFQGYIDEVRVLSQCIYKNGTTFTVPQYPVPAYTAAQTLPVVGTGSGGSGLSWSSVPASATASGTAGQIAYDALGKFYLCTATNTWRRTTLSSWVSDPYFSSVSLLLHMSGANGSTTFSDSSSAARTVTPSGSAAISTAQSRFGGSSGYFNMSADYLDIANNAAFDFGTGDFTIETWFYASAASGENYYPIFHNSLLFYAANTGSNSGRVMVFDGSTNVVDTGVSGNVFSLNTWTHLAWVRSSGVITIYVDGISKASATVSGSISSGSPNRIGRFGSASFSGATAYIDDLRITKGVARTITVPTAAYPDE